MSMRMSHRQQAYVFLEKTYVFVYIIQLIGPAEKQSWNVFLLFQITLER